MHLKIREIGNLKVLWRGGLTKDMGLGIPSW